jgi:fructose-1,6-bisphosphatase I
MKLDIGTTLDEFIIRREKNYPDATGDLSKLLRDIGVASKLINRSVNKAGLVDILGAAGQTNIQGEEVQKLDDYSNDVLKNYIANGGQLAGFGSEEEDEVVIVTTEEGKNADYVVLFDPLDGSKNIDINASIGTIFSIYKRKDKSKDCSLEDFLQKGTEVVAAGYIIYGSSTMLVYSAGNGVNGFTLDPSIGEFCLSHQDMKMNKTGGHYSVNQANYLHFPENVRRYLDYLVEDREMGMRYIGSMVGDVHRTLLKGGVFMYPATTSAPGGKLRLLYECIPMSFLVNQAGGKSSDGEKSILKVIPTELHQRCPVFIGNSDLIDILENDFPIIK